MLKWFPADVHSRSFRFNVARIASGQRWTRKEDVCSAMRSPAVHATSGLDHVYNQTLHRYEVFLSGWKVRYLFFALWNSQVQHNTTVTTTYNCNFHEYIRPICAHFSWKRNFINVILTTIFRKPVLYSLEFNLIFGSCLFLKWVYTIYSFKINNHFAPVKCVSVK